MGVSSVNADDRCRKLGSGAGFVSYPVNWISVNMGSPVNTVNFAFGQKFNLLVRIWINPWIRIQNWVCKQ
jgi:hypothetical protein